MKSNKNIVMLIILCVVVLLAVIAVFFVNKNSVNNCIKDEKVQVETLKEICCALETNLRNEYSGTDEGIKINVEPKENGSFQNQKNKNQS